MRCAVPGRAQPSRLSGSLTHSVRRNFAKEAEKGGDKSAFDAKRVSKSKSKADAAGIAEYQRLAKLINPTPFKPQRSPEEIAYATALGKIYNRNTQADAWRLQRALQRTIRCKQAAIAALPTEALRAQAKVVDDEWIPEKLAGPNRLLTSTPPLPGYASLIPDEEELKNTRESDTSQTQEQQ